MLQFFGCSRYGSASSPQGSTSADRSFKYCAGWSWPEHIEVGIPVGGGHPRTGHEVKREGKWKGAIVQYFLGDQQGGWGQ